MTTDDAAQLHDSPTCQMVSAHDLFLSESSAVSAETLTLAPISI